MAYIPDSEGKSIDYYELYRVVDDRSLKLRQLSL